MLDTKYVSKESLLNYLYSKLDMEQSCCDDLELTENQINEFSRGKIVMLELIINEVQKLS